MKNHSMLKIIFTTALFLSATPFVVAATELPSGNEIANNINARYEGISVSRSMTMEMTDRRGKQRVRKTKSFRKYYGDEKRTVIHYLSPKNVKKTAFLTFDYPDANKDDDQWLYLPAMRKVRRISASDRGDYFLGTDFTYEDIKKETRVSIEDYTRTTLREEEIDGVHSYVVESVPVSEEIAEELGYGKIVQWVDSKIWISRKADFYDIRGQLLKTTVTSEIRKVQDIWTAHRIEVDNHKTGHNTVFVFSDVVYDSEVRDDYFTQRSIRRGI